jgi:hypothetical protein
VDGCWSMFCEVRINVALIYIILYDFCIVYCNVYCIDILMFCLLQWISQVLNVTVRVIQRDAHERKTAFHPRPYFRLFVTWLMDFNSADSTLDSSNFQVYITGNWLLFLWGAQPTSFFIKYSNLRLRVAGVPGDLVTLGQTC